MSENVMLDRTEITLFGVTTLKEEIQSLCPSCGRWAYEVDTDPQYSVYVHGFGRHCVIPVLEMPDPVEEPQYYLPPSEMRG